MNSTAQGIKKTMDAVGIRGINKIGERICEECGTTVPIMQRKDHEGEVHEDSVCLTCETNKTKSRFPAKDNLLQAKAQGFSRKYEAVPKKLIGKTVNEYIPDPDNESEKKMKTAIKDFIINFGKTDHNSLILAGKMGLGKSHLAYAAAAELRKRGYSTMFIGVDDFLKLIKSTYEREIDLSEKTIFEMIEEIDLLVFDEIGAEYNNQKNEYESWASEKILKVTDLREKSSTIFTTNYSPADFEKKYGEIQGGRIVSRMQSGAKRIVVEGRDRR